MKVSEIFYSLQGEGGRAGQATIFVRLSGCSAKHACYQSGIRCDTEFESGREMSAAEIRNAIVEECARFFDVQKKDDLPMLVWTGGEPLDQLTPEIVEELSGFCDQGIETSGVRPIPSGMRFDYICISPKVAEHVLKKNFPNIEVDELRYVRHAGQDIPQPCLSAAHYFISPHFDGYTPNEENIRHCIKLCKENPAWRLSLQLHKLVGIL